MSDTSKGAVVVGGVGEGLGFAVAQCFARADHHVVMLGPIARRGGAAVPLRTKNILERRAIALRAEPAP